MAERGGIASVILKLSIYRINLLICDRVILLKRIHHSIKLKPDSIATNYERNHLLQKAIKI